MKIEKLFAIAVALLIATAVFMTGCATEAPSIALTQATTQASTGEASTDEPTTEPLSGKLNISGSTSMLELVQELAAKFMEVNNGVTIDVQGGGSGVGLQNVVDGLSDIGNSSSTLKDSDKEKGLIGTEIALDGVAVIVNPKNPLTDLSEENIVKIFKGEITNWKDVGGADHTITVVNREASSGTREAMGKLFGLVEKDAAGKTVELFTEKAIEQNSGGGVITTVAGDEFAIGYVSIGSVKDSIKALAVDGVTASKVTILDGTYKYWRPFVMATKGDAQGLAKTFLEWCVNDPAAQEIVNHKFIAIAEKK